MGLREYLEEQIEEDLKLLKKLEDRLRTESDPRLELRWTEEINKVKLQIRQREEELRSLSASSVQPESVTPSPSQPATPPLEPKQKIKRSNVIALSSLMVAIVAMIVIVAIPEVLCFLGLPSESCPSPQITPTLNGETTKNNEQPQSSPSTTTVESGPTIIIIISKETGVNYTLLRDLLAAGKWKEADEETARVMFQVAGRENEEFLRKEDIDNFPCEDLSIINKLWLDYSKGKFGFSVQQDIYKRLTGTIEDRECIFADEVGWLKTGTCDEKDWLEDDKYTFNLKAPKGHLPAFVQLMPPNLYVDDFLTRTTECKI